MILETELLRKLDVIIGEALFNIKLNFIYSMNNILFISGSLRKESFNTKILKAFARAMPENIEVVWADLNLPLYNEDLEDNFPPEVNVLREQILKSDLVIISTPEYNRGISSVLRNALDWASRPSGENAWVDKRVFVMSSSTGGLSGALAFYQAKQSLLHLKAEVISYPEFMLGRAPEKFDEAGNLTDERTKEFIDKTLQEILK